MALALEVHADPDAVAERAAQFVAERANAAVADHGRFTVAVSGGHTPWAMFARLVTKDMPWEEVTIFQVDERIAPTVTLIATSTHLGQSLPAGCGADVRPMPVNAGDLEWPPLNTRGRCLSRSTSSTSASGPTATRHRSFRATPCSR